MKLYNVTFLLMKITSRYVPGGIVPNLCLCFVQNASNRLTSKYVIWTFFMNITTYCAIKQCEHVGKILEEKT